MFDKEREQAKLASLKEMAHNDFNRHGVEELFQQIMSMSRKLQYQLLAQNGASGRLPFIAVDDIDRTNIRAVYREAWRALTAMRPCVLISGTM